MNSFSTLFVLCVAMTSPAIASGADSSRGFLLSAKADSFCRIDAPRAATVALRDGAADLGMVTESCNAAAGYVIRAEFENLRQGMIKVGDERATVDEQGSASFSYDQAQRQQRRWLLEQAAPVHAGAPVFIRLSIAPL